MSTEHEATPRPWTIRVIEPEIGQLRHDMHARIEAPFKANGEGIPGKFYEVAMLNFVAMKRNKYNILRDEGVANAELIVTAVNAHDAMLHVLRELVEALESGKGFDNMVPYYVAARVELDKIEGVNGQGDSTAQQEL